MAEHGQVNDTLVRINQILKGDPPLVDGQNEEVGKLLSSIKQLTEAKSEEMNIPERDKAFIEYAKAASNSYAVVFNATNAFGTATSFALHEKVSNNLDSFPEIKLVFIALTLSFLPFTLLTVGLAHALPHHKKLINSVAMMLIMEVVYMSVTCGLFGYYLISVDGGFILVLIFVTVGAAFLALVPIRIFKRPLLCKCCDAEGGQTGGRAI